MSLFVIDLHYVCDLVEIDALVEDHRSFLKRNYEAGLFLASGPKRPRTGGVILARGDDCAEIEAAIQSDPFHTAGLAEYTVTEFTPLMQARDFQF